MHSFLAVVLVLGVLIAFHEMGHFLMARVLGIGVKTFSVGFGPRLLGFRGKLTDYRLSIIPLGGFVSLVGESEEGEIPERFEERHSFMKRPAWQRMLVVLAGPLFNVVLAMLIYWGLFWAQGQYELLPVVGEVRAESPAQVAGMEAGDRILAIDGQDIRFWREMAALIESSEGRTLAMVVQRGGRELELNVTPKVDVRKNLFGEDIRTPLIGISSAGETMVIPLDGGSSFLAGARQTWDMVSLTAVGFWKIIQGIVPLDNVGGPIMIAQLVSEQAKRNISDLLFLTALISVNLGLLNLLPIPVLDGGHILFYGIEAVTRRPVNAKVREVTTRIGLTFLILLMLLAIYNDLQRTLP